MDKIESSFDIWLLTDCHVQDDTQIYFRLGQGNILRAVANGVTNKCLAMELYSDKGIGCRDKFMQ